MPRLSNQNESGGGGAAGGGGGGGSSGGGGGPYAWLRRRFERAGLLFLDDDIEAEFQRAASQSSSGAAVLTAVIVCNVLVAVATVCVWNNADTTDDGVPPEWTTGVGLAFSLLATAALVVSLVVRGSARVGCGSHAWLAVAAWLVAVSFPFAYFDMLAMNVIARESVPGAGLLIGSSTNLLALTVQERDYAKAEAGPNFSALAVVWVFQNVVVITNVLSARALLFFVPLNLAYLAVPAWDLFGVILADGGASYGLCSGLIFVDQATVQIVCQLALKFVAASVALTWVVARSEVATRKLFAWTRALRLNARQLRREADPFNPANIRRWLERCDGGDDGGNGDGAGAGGRGAGGSRWSMASSTASRRELTDSGWASDDGCNGDAATAAAWTRTSAETTTTPPPAAAAASTTTTTTIGTTGSGGGDDSDHHHGGNRTMAAGRGRGGRGGRGGGGGGDEHFWAIPSGDLKLVDKVAAGAGGVVWRARLRASGQLVAAKLITSSISISGAGRGAGRLPPPSSSDSLLVNFTSVGGSTGSDMSSVSDALGGGGGGDGGGGGGDAQLDELAHEVALLGQLDHNNVVKFLGLCRCEVRNLDDDGDDDGGGGGATGSVRAVGVFIVQEYCPANLRGLMQDARTAPAARSLSRPSSTASLASLASLASSSAAAAAVASSSLPPPPQHRSAAAFRYPDYAAWVREAARLAREICAGMTYVVVVAVFWFVCFGVHAHTHRDTHTHTHTHTHAHRDTHTHTHTIHVYL
jgi:hypothetical protein